MRTIVVLLALMCGATAMADDGWLEIAQTNEQLWHIKSGSFESTKTKGGKRISVVVGRATSKKTSATELNKWYVSDDDCNARMGKFVTLALDGSFLYEVDFVFSSGSVASIISEMICAVRAQQTLENEKKGI